MIVYLDASVLVKRYVAEPGSKETAKLIAHAEVVATSLISRAEVAAAPRMQYGLWAGNYPFP